MVPKKSKSINKNDLSRKRRKKRNLKVYVYSFFAVTFVVGFIFFIRMDTFRIKEVNVTGASERNTSLIKQNARELMQGTVGFIVPKDSVFFYPQQQIASSIKTNFPSLSSVKVNTGLTGSLEIKVEERKQSALWCASSICYFMDEAGFVFARASQGESISDNSYIKYQGLIQGDPINHVYGNKVLGDSFFKNLNSFIDNLHSSGVDIYAVNIIDNNNAEAVVREGFDIKFNPLEINKPELMKNLDVFLNNLKTSNGGVLPSFSYIDARYGNKIFYRLK